MKLGTLESMVIERLRFDRDLIGTLVFLLILMLSVTSRSRYTVYKHV